MPPPESSAQQSPKHPSPQRRLALSTGTRLAVVGAAALFALLAASAAFSMSYGRLVPDTAMGLWPKNGRVFARASALALARAAGEGSQLPKNVPGKVRRLAATAVALEPTSASAVRDLGLYASSRGDRAKARRLMRAGVRLTRRNPGMNLWLIEDYSRLGQEDQALRLWDVTLRTSTTAAATLLPAMAAALRNPAAPALFEPLLVARPPWDDDFWTAVIQDSSALDNTIALRERLHRRGVPMARSHDALIARQLIAAKRFAPAFKLYETVSRETAGATAELLVDGDFARQSDFAPIGWKVESTETFGAYVDDKRGRLVLSALPGGTGAIAQQLIRIAPGAYHLEIAYGDGANATGRPIELRLACAELAGEATLDTRLAVTRSGARNFRIQGPCRHAWVTLFLLDRVGEAGLETQIDRVSLRRIG